MSFGLVGRVLAIEAAVFVLAAILLPLIVLPLPKAQAILWLAFALAALLVLSGALIAWRVARPLARIVRAAEAVSDPADELLPESEVTDELGRLSRALNRMTRRLHERTLGLERSVRELEAERATLRAANEALVRTDRLASVGQLAAGVAHEIGNPLQVIHGFVALARESGVGEVERAEYLGRVQAEVDRIQRLVRELVDYARPPVATVGPVDLRAPLGAAVALVAPQPRLRGITITQKVAADAPLALADEARIAQVLLNLLLNAADALGGRGEIVVSLAPSSEVGFVEVAVADDGAGIAPENQERIFEPFFTTKAVGEGTGLGLAISRRIVESLGGRLSVESAPGRGTTFTIRLRAIH